MTDPQSPTSPSGSRPEEVPAGERPSATDAADQRGRHAAPPRARTPVVLAALGALAVLVGGYYLLQHDRQAESASGRCTDPIPLTVAADPVIASAIDSFADTMRDACVTLEVHSEPSAGVAATLARPATAGLNTPLPDVWIPDSTLWVTAATADEGGLAKVDGTITSVASSPVVIAMDRKAATATGAPAKATSWVRLVSDSSALRVGTADPRSHSPSLIALVAASGGTPSTATVAALSRHLTVVTAVGSSPAESVATGHVDAAPTSEADVIAVSSTPRGKGRVVAGYDPKMGALDFPMVPLAGRGDVSAQVRKVAVQKLRDVLVSTQGAQAVREAGLRDPAGALATGIGPGHGIKPSVKVPRERLEAKTIDAASQAWAFTGRRSRIMVLFDRSGSMLEPMPGGSTPKYRIAQSSMRAFVDVAAPDSQIGLSTFTTAGRAQDIRVLAPVAAMSTREGGVDQRTRLRGAVPALAPLPIGDTPLYDAVKRAYGDAQASYVDGRLNAIIVVTDGRNDALREEHVARAAHRLPRAHI